MYKLLNRYFFVTRDKSQGKSAVSCVPEKKTGTRRNSNPYVCRTAEQLDIYDVHVRIPTCNRAEQTRAGKESDRWLDACKNYEQNLPLFIVVVVLHRRTLRRREVPTTNHGHLTGCSLSLSFYLSLPHSLSPSFPPTLHPSRSDACALPFAPAPSPRLVPKLALGTLGGQMGPSFNLHGRSTRYYAALLFFAPDFESKIV